MKRSKKLLLMLGLLLVVCAGAFAAQKISVKREAAAENDGEAVILALPAADVNALKIDGSDKLAFTRMDGAWTCDADAAFPVDGGYIDAALDSLNELTAIKTIENAGELSQYGLDEPALLLTVDAGDAVTIEFGDSAAMADGQYVSLGDGNVYIVDSGIMSAFQFELLDAAEKETIPDMSGVTAVEIKTGDTLLTLEHMTGSDLAYSDSYVWFTQADGEYVTLDTELTGALWNEILYMSWGSCVCYNADEAALAEYGLEEPAAAVRVDYLAVTGDGEDDEQSSAESFTLELGTDADGVCYARIAGSGMVYMFDSAVLDALAGASVETLLPDDVLKMDWDEVTALDVTLDGATRHITGSTSVSQDENGNSAEERVWLLDGEEIDIEGVLNELTAMVSTGSTKLKGGGGSELALTIYRDDAKFPKVELEFLEYDSISCLVSINGEERLLTGRDTVLSIADELRQLLGD